MDLKIKIALYVFFIVTTVAFGYGFRVQYDKLGAERQELPSDLEEVPEEGYRQTPAPNPALSALFIFGGAFVLSSVGLALLVGRDISNYFGDRFSKFLYGEEGAGMPGEEYEEAEEEWANGNYLRAIQSLRDYLGKNPREHHAAIRIAEIYEKDLQNYLAAAMEYEEVLRRPLPPERWGWAAIHLCNLYSSRLEQPKKAVELLRRICNEYGQTTAAKKARERLAQIGEESEEEGESSETEQSHEEPEPRDGGSNLPPGFTPKK